MQADVNPHDGTITLRKWLEYGVVRVPSLYSEVENGVIDTFGDKDAPSILSVTRGTVMVSKVRGRSVQDNYQQPALFDFDRRQNDAVLVSAGE
jgi:hypothetical protein